MARPPRTSDHWTRKAKEAGFPARSVYKLSEIDGRHHIVPVAGRVLDLGCSPGSWSRYVARKAGPAGRLVGVDLTPVPDLPGTFVQGSIYELDPELLREALGGPADLVLSDMAPSTTGSKVTDHLQQVALAEQALALAQVILAPGGAFVVKVFDGGDAPAFVASVRAAFATVKRMKPEATRRESREFFLIGLGFRG